MSLLYGDSKDSLANRKIFLSVLGINYQDLVCAKQVHGARVKYVKESDRGEGALSYDTSLPDTDGVISDIRNLPLAIFTADCLSVFLYDPSAAGIAIVHAGWRSSKENILARTVQLMQEKFNTKPQDLYVGFGPSLRQCCYEVGEEFNDYFPSNIEKRNKDYYLDLIGINKTQLLGLGLNEEKISDCKICTSCQNKEYFSYRREGKTCGRMISVIMLR